LQQSTIGCIWNHERGIRRSRCVHPSTTRTLKATPEASSRFRGNPNSPYLKSLVRPSHPCRHRLHWTSSHPRIQTCCNPRRSSNVTV